MRRSSLLIIAMIAMTGCAPETVVVNPGVVMRLAAPATAKVATYDADQKAWIVRGNVTLQEGGYYVPAVTATQPAR